MTKHLAIIAVITLTLLSSFTRAQDDFDFRKADITTYNAYMQQRWKDLSDTAEMAIAKGYDYYYMRMRAGIACSEMKKYRKAIPHFQKALQFNSDDPAAKELLYKAYLNAGFHHQAAWLYANDSVKPKKIIAVIPEAGLCKISEYNHLQLEYKKPDPALNYFFEKDLSGPFSYYSAYFIHEISPRWQIDHAFSFLTMEKFKEVQYDLNSLTNPKHIVLNNIYNTKQYSWFINPSFYASENRRWSFFLHSFLVRSNSVNYNLTGAVMPYIPVEGNHDIQPVTYVVKNDSVPTTLFEATAGIQLIKHKTYFERQIHFSLYAGSESTRLQAGYTATFYPWASPVFSSSTSVFGLLGGEPSVVLKQVFRFQPVHNLSAEFYGLAGNMAYFTDNNGSVVYNFPDIMRLKAGITVQYFPLKKLGLSAGYTLSQNETTFYWNRFRGFTNKGDVRFERSVELHQYTNQIIYGGIIWVL